MPNWCTNILTIEGDAVHRSIFDEAFKGPIADWGKDPSTLPETIYSFNALMPVPDEVIEAGYDRTGYNWCIANWGTKWDPGTDIVLEEDEGKLSYYFDTAWSPPEPFIGTVSTKFPNLKFTLDYVELGMCFCGRVVYQNGEQWEDLQYDSSTPAGEEFIRKNIWDDYENTYEED